MQQAPDRVPVLLQPVWSPLVQSRMRWTNHSIKIARQDIITIIIIIIIII